MKRAFLTVFAVLLATLVAAATAERRPAGAAKGDPSRALAHPLPPAGALARRRVSLTRGPRVIAGVPVAGRRIDLWGAADGRRRMLVAGCVNGRWCAGEDVVAAVGIGCPPDDVDVWLFRTLRPGGADLDAEQDTRGAAAWRRAVSALRPHVAVAIRTGAARGAVVLAAGDSAAEGRRLAGLAALPFREEATEGLTSWAATARPGTAGITIELPPRRLGPREVSHLAYALHRFVGTRFARGAQEQRMRMIEHGADPRNGERG